MIFRKFGSTGQRVSVIGQGTWMMEGDPARERQAIETLQRGIDLGMTHIDTAEMYGDGRVEEVVGEAIAGRRHQVFLASKVLPSNASFDGTQRACERSLKRLRTDRLDLYMLHWPGEHPIRETMRGMEKLVSEGLIRFVGVSNFDLEELGAAENALRHDPMAADQVLYNLEERGIEGRLLPYCERRKIALVAYSPFGHGKFPSSRSIGGRVLALIAERHGRTPRQVALNFLTRHPGVFGIPKATRLEHAIENADSVGWTLTNEDIAMLDRAFPVPDHDVPLTVL
jgi:diketogulonate reductase-like aldo/keto reductase